MSRVSCTGNQTCRVPCRTEVRRGAHCVCYRFPTLGIRAKAVIARTSSCPKVMVPRQILDTLSPLRPKYARGNCFSAAISLLSVVMGNSLAPLRNKMAADSDRQASLTIDYGPSATDHASSLMYCVLTVFCKFCLTVHILLSLLESFANYTDVVVNGLALILNYLCVFPTEIGVPGCLATDASVH